MRRKRLVPKTLADYAAVVLLVTMFPVTYWFEIFIVLPLYYEAHNPVYIFHIIMATYLLFSVVCNYVAVFVIDTSIKGRFLSSEMKPTWKFCEICECITPPRSWHCGICNICILKRDHHCNFTSCCVGHYNQRYFFMFLFYFTAATIYASYFNVFYLWDNTSFTFVGLIKVCLPLAALVFGNDELVLQWYRILCVLVIVGMIAGLVMFYFHCINVYKGMVMYEKVKNIRDYDLGSTKENIRQVFGKRWYLTWISPFIESELPCDGIHWDEMKLLSSKSK